ncbi:glutathione S-transferase family protein [soil metagenome]
MKLYIGNKNYSTWSLRAWLILKQAEIPFEEIKLHMDPTPGSDFKKQIEAIAPAGRVPVLVDDDGLAIWDSLAIAEYLAETFPEKKLWPADASKRARARSLCAEMHSGFTAMRTHLALNVVSSFAEIGARVMSERPDAVADVARIDQIFSSQLAESGGPFLFGEFSIADAFFAPVCMRFRTYSIPLSAASAGYMERILGLAPMQAWTWDAIAESDFIEAYEPYRDHR